MRPFPRLPLPAPFQRLLGLGLLLTLAVGSRAQEAPPTPTPTPAPAPVPAEPQEKPAAPAEGEKGEPKAPRKRANGKAGGGAGDQEAGDAQERPNKQGKKGNQGKRRNQGGKEGAPEEPAQPPAPPQRVVDCTTLGSNLATLPFFDAAATADGRRTQFDPIEAGVAFEVWLEGIEPRPLNREEPDPDHPGQMRTVPGTGVAVLKVPDAEWDEYWNYLMRFVPPGDEAMFVTVVLAEMIEQKAMLLHYRDDLADVEKRAAAALAKLKAGATWRDVVRSHSEDSVSRDVDGLTLEDERGPLLYLYPFPKALFELEQGDIVGPVYNKQAAYILKVDKITRSANAPWHDLYRASSVVLRYPAGPNLKAINIAEIKSSARVRTAQERFRRVLPPGMQVPSPSRFGPDDIAPIGEPGAQLKRRSVEDAKDQPPAHGG
ncbi:MAG: peptidyl-prolyl cis-trans isomerase [Planctomycetes bacterium]|nr:peptidyl-prolyl cis-trans isomerase [Planctomycetota bacterium]